MYKTACNHIFCPACAETHFSKDPHCPVESWCVSSPMKGCLPDRPVPRLSSPVHTLIKTNLASNLKLTQRHFTGPIDVGVMATESLESALYKSACSHARFLALACRIHTHHLTHTFCSHPLQYLLLPSFTTAVLSSGLLQDVILNALNAVPALEVRACTLSTPSPHM